MASAEVGRSIAPSGLKNSVFPQNELLRLGNDSVRRFERDLSITQPGTKECAFRGGRVVACEQ